MDKRNRTSWSKNGRQHHEARAEGHHDGEARSGVAQGPGDEGSDEGWHCHSCQQQHCINCQLKQSYVNKKRIAQSNYNAAKLGMMLTLQQLQEQGALLGKAREELKEVDEVYRDLCGRRVQDELHRGRQGAGQVQGPGFNPTPAKAGTNAQTNKETTQERKRKNGSQTKKETNKHHLQQEG
jgi:hypothetical protein